MLRVPPQFPKIVYPDEGDKVGKTPNITTFRSHQTRLPPTTPLALADSAAGKARSG
jgi:hypothetical protein